LHPMKRLVSRLAVLAAGLAVLALVAGAIYYLGGRAWMDRWGATDAEIGAALPGDELVAQPVDVVNRAVTIRAAPEAIYPWLVQMGAGKGGMYSYTGIETYLLNCPLVNAETIHPEWQALKVGDEVKMCPQGGPPPYLVAALEPNRAVVLGHQNPQGVWEETWAFVITPQPDGTSRLVARDRTLAAGGFWEVIHPGIFVMERGMLLGIQQRAER
jgi:hypothetical protein